jgi:predicted nucleic acid-binding protein
MIYLDASFFVIAALDAGENGNGARACIRLMNERADTVALTSLLTFDEVAYAVKKQEGRESGIRAGEALLGTNILFSDITRDIVGHALPILKHNGLDPRDALHAATMKKHSVQEIVSADADFDRVPWLKRISVQQFLARLKRKSTSKH